jgi:hypothetical protein
VASQDEMILVELTDRIPAQDLLKNLSPHVPSGLGLLSADWLETGEKKTPREATYEIRGAAWDKADLSRRASELLASSAFEIDRSSTPSSKAKRIDIRPYVASILVDDDSLRWTQLVTQGGTVRIGEMLTALGLKTEDHLHRVCRLHVDYEA